MQQASPVLPESPVHLLALPMQMEQRQGARNWRRHIAAAAILALFVGALFYPLLFTNRVLATGDILLYFYPYRDYVAAALRSGQLPFWNPYLFAGAPLLANPQAAVLYPLHWPLVALPVTAQIYWSAALHVWLLGFGGYWLLRRWGYGGWAGLTTGIVLAGSGFAGGLLGHINQLNAVAWLPWAVVCVEGCAPRPGAPPTPTLRAGIATPEFAASVAGLGVVVALMLLAGHTQSAYINLFGLGVWVVFPLLVVVWRGLVRRLRPAAIIHSQFTLYNPQLIQPLLIYTGGVLLGTLLSGAQLLPTLELSGLGLRSGGLAYLDASSFSLKPLQLGWTLLPSYGLANLGAIFDTPGYTEYVAYVGLAGLLLAVAGAWRGRGSARAFGLLFAALGLLLAVGRWSPLYYLLYQVIPGFDLFRAPARWMMLYTMGMAVLAGTGMDYAARTLFSRRWAMASLTALVAIDLILAARALPHTQPTAPQAVYDVRTAPAHLLTDPARAASGPAASGRFLGTSAITYDPGDRDDYRRIMLDGDPPQLSKTGFDDLTVAQKVQELLVPNLPLYWRIPSVDGFDGGVLPLQRYNQFLQLLLPGETLAPDGRLREQVKNVPPAWLLGLMNIQYVITDKVRDLWFENVYYDRQIGARVSQGHPQSIAVPVPFEATHVDLIAYIEAGDEVFASLAGSATPVAAVQIITAAGTGPEPVKLAVTAGGAAGAQLADGALDSAMAATNGATVAYRDIEAGRQEYRVRLPLAQPITPTQVGITALDPRIAVVVQAATLYDARTGMFAALLPSDRGHFVQVHSGDVKIYENRDLHPRAYLVGSAQAATNTQEALDLLRNGGDLEDSAVVEGGPALAHSAAPSDRADLVGYLPERVEVHTHSAGPALLVLSDAYYPGWTATVDGQPTRIYPANVLFRGVYVPRGDHTVVFSYQPTDWQRGLWLSAGGFGLILALCTMSVWQRIRRSRAVAV